MNAREQVLNYAKFNNLPHWKIYRGTDVKPSAVVATSEVIEVFGGGTLSLSTSQEKLKEALSYLPNGEYLVHFKQEAKDTLPKINYPFRIEDSAHVSGPAALVQQQPMTGMFNMETMQMFIDTKIAGITEKFEKERLQEKVDDLRKELNQLRKGGAGTGEWSALLREAKEIFFAMKQTDQPQTRVAIGKVHGPPINNTSTAEKGEADTTQQDENNNTPAETIEPELLELYKESLEELFEKLGGVRKGMVTLICLNQMAEDEPATFNFALSQLKKYEEVVREMGIDTGK